MMVVWTDQIATCLYINLINSLSTVILAPTTIFRMSRFNDPNVRPMFASKTKFDALTVDSGEESEETTEPEMTTTTERFVTQSFPKFPVNWRLVCSKSQKSRQS